MTIRSRLPIALFLILMNGFAFSAQAQEVAAPPNAVVPPVVTADAVQEAFVRVAERVKPSVVNILAERRAATPETTRSEKPTPDKKPPAPKDKTAPRQSPTPEKEQAPDILPFPFGPDDSQRSSSMGTGMVVRADGFILTNHHIVKDATSLRVLINADSEQPDRPVARVVAFDEESDLAVLKIERNGLRAIEFADSDSVRIGEWAIAIGAPFEQAQTVTVGIISAKGRHLPTRERLSLQDYIQTDASINPGNSGGPLVNLEGKVIGINTAILSPSRFNVGIGFSVPSNTVRSYLPTLISGKPIERGFLGINYVRIDPEVAREFGVADGVQIGAMAMDSNNKPTGPASAAGLQPGDIITTVNDTVIDSSDRFRRIVSSTAPGQPIRLSVVRPSGETTEKLNLVVTLGDWAKQNNVVNVQQNVAPKPGTSRLGLDIADVSQLNALERDLFALESVTTGAVVRDVEPGSPADDAQMARGSLLTRMRVAGGSWQKIADRSAFERLERSLRDGARILMELRSGRGVVLYKVVVAPPSGTRAD